MEVWYDSSAILIWFYDNETNVLQIRIQEKRFHLRWFLYFLAQHFSHIFKSWST